MMKKQYKPVLVLDFDGVIHSYSSGWKGASVIPDAPVPQAIHFILDALHYFDVAILSSRSHQWGGKRAMKKWLKKHLIEWISDTYEYPAQSVIDIWNLADFKPGMAPWEIEVNDWADSVINKIKWPFFKPAATLTIDDRAITFTGVFPRRADELKNFKPWNK